MAKDYTKEELKNSSILFGNRLTTRVLEDFYIDNLIPNTYIYLLNNGEIIHLLFENDQFCHLLGFSYFGYNGASGWNLLNKRNIRISNLNNIKNHKREEIRITNFPKILKILDNPTMYIYKNTDMRYKADYFAVWDDGRRYYKLGIGTGYNGVNYGETFQVSLMESKDNKEIDLKNLVEVKSKYVMPKDVFKELYYPKHLEIKKQGKKIEDMDLQLEKLRELEWRVAMNTSTN